MKKTKAIFAAVLLSVLSANFSFAESFCDFWDDIEFFFIGIGIDFAADVLIDDTLDCFNGIWDDDDYYCYEDASYLFSYEKSRLFYAKGKKAEKEKRYVHALSYYYDAYDCNEDNLKAVKAYLKLSKKIFYEKINSEELLKSLKDYYNEYPYFGLAFSDAKKKNDGYTIKHKIYVTKKNKEITETVLMGLDYKDKGKIKPEEVTVKISGSLESMMTDNTLCEFNIESQPKKVGETVLNVPIAEYGTNFEIEHGYYKVVVKSFMMKRKDGEYKPFRVDGVEVRK